MTAPSAGGGLFYIATKEFAPNATLF